MRKGYYKLYTFNVPDNTHKDFKAWCKQFSKDFDAKALKLKLKCYPITVERLRVEGDIIIGGEFTGIYVKTEQSFILTPKPEGISWADCHPKFGKFKKMTDNVIKIRTNTRKR